MKKGIKWMFNSASPLYIKPRLDLDFLKWAWAFNNSCNATHVKKAIPVIKDISLLSQELYDEIKKSENFKCHYEKKGLLILCQTDKMLEEEIYTAKIDKQRNLNSLKLIPLDSSNIKFNRSAHEASLAFLNESTMYFSGGKVNINDKIVYNKTNNKRDFIFGN